MNRDARNRNAACRRVVTPARTYPAVAVLTCGLIAASCGGGGDSTPQTVLPQSAVKSFRVQQYFNNILERGASYSMRGQFVDGNGGPVTQQQHDQISFPITDFAGTWRGNSNLRRRQVRVTRIVDGAPGVVGVYNGYFDADNIEIGTQADGADNYTLFGPHVRQPASAQVGDAGAGPLGQRFMGDGSVRDQFLRWNMQAVNDHGRYCQTVTESNAGDGSWIWDQTWCYDMAQDGTPLGYISYSYDAGAGYTGLISDDNLQYPLSGTAPAPSGANPDSFKLAAYFKRLRDSGVTYTLLGEFRDGGGNTTQQKHVHTRLPPEDFGPFKDFADTRRQSVRVVRTVNGQPGASDVYNRYYNPDGVHVATQADGQSGYHLFDLYRNRPVSAQVGDSGSGPHSLLLDENGQPVGKRTMSRWEMTMRGDMPLYCETIDETDNSDQPVWQFTWCYEVKSDGTPGSYISFGYDGGGGSVGLLEATDLRLLDASAPPPAPEPLPECQVNCNNNDLDFGF